MQFFKVFTYHGLNNKEVSLNTKFKGTWYFIEKGIQNVTTMKNSLKYKPENFF